MSLSDIIRRKEEELRRVKDHEAAVVYDSFGNIVVEEHGVGSSVNLGPYIEQVRRIGGVTLVHNHPLGWKYPLSDPRHAGSSFSPEDTGTACYAELAEIRAVGSASRYILRPAATSKWNGDSWVDDVLPHLKRHKSGVIRATLEAVAERRISREIAESTFWHEVWLRVAADLSLGYGRFEDE